MDNATRATLDAWLPLIKGLSFDERVGFITGKLVGFSASAGIHDNIRLTTLSVRDKIHAALIEIQNEAHTNAKVFSQSLKIEAPATTSDRTAEQLREYITQVARKGAGDAKAAAKIIRLAKELKRIEGK